MDKETRKLLNELNVPWITEDGYFDFTKYPIDGVLRQTLSADKDTFGSGCRMLNSMHINGREEAGIYLLGLLYWFRDDLDKLIMVVEALSRFTTKACAEALFSELRRVPSSNATRRYLNQVIKELSTLPRELVEDGFVALSEDKSFTYRMRNKFKAISQQWQPPMIDYYLDEEM